MKRFMMLLSLFVALTAQAIERPLSFNHIDSNQGLPDNYVKAIVRDSCGFMWFGTRGGLCRYDGAGFKQYDVDDPLTGRSNHNVAALFEDDQRQLWVGTDQGVFIFDPRTERFRSFDVATAQGEHIGNWISQITADHDGQIWIVAPVQGAFRYNPRTGTMQLVRTNHAGDGLKNNPQCVCVRPNGDIWLGTTTDGLYQYDRASGSLRHVLTDAQGNSLEGDGIMAMCNYGDEIAIGVHQRKLRLYNPTTNTLRDHPCQDVHYKIICDLSYDGTDLFVATWNGIYILNEHTGEYLNLRETPNLPYALSANLTYRLYQDADRGIWVGTMTSGVDYIARSGLSFYTYVPQAGGSGTVSSKHLRQMVATPQGDVWIGTEEGGIDIYHPLTRDFTHLDLPHWAGGANRLSLMYDGEGRVWSGVFSNGLDIIDIATHTVRHIDPKELGIWRDGSVYAMLRDSHGRIWIGTGDGLYLKRGRDSLQCIDVERLRGCWVQDMAEDRAGHIWVASMGWGLYCYDPTTGDAMQFTTGNSGLSSNSLSSVTIDHDNNLWVGTDRGGLCHYDQQTGLFTTYGRQQGMPDDVAYKALEDQHHNTWVGTNHGLVRLQGKNREVTVYRNTNVRLGNQYTYNSGIAVGDSLMLIGSTDGLLVFNPLKADDERQRQVHITNIRVDNRELRPDSTGRLSCNILFTDRIELPHSMASLSFDVSTLDYQAMRSDNFEYQLVGVDPGWQVSTSGRNIYYTHLQPGHYVFRVRRGGTDAQPTQLQVVVLPPWYLSLWAKLAYALLVLASLGGGLWWLLRRQSRRMKMREEAYKEEKEKEVLHSKLNFITDLTADIRTPLTLISGSVENIMEGQESEKHLQTISRNTERLLSLTNQLFDFTRHEAIDVYEADRNSSDDEEAELPEVDNPAPLNAGTVLYVEPDDEMRGMMAPKLARYYKLLTATSIDDAINTLQDNRVSLIVIDASNDGIDGLALATGIRQDPAWGYLPVLLMSDRLTSDGRIKALKAGVDTVIEKPFAFSHLMVQIEMLFANRRKECQLLLKRPYLSMELEGADLADEELMERLQRILVCHLSDSAFGVDELASAMAMSRSNLLRRMKNIIGMTPVEYIRYVRLQRAAELILDGTSVADAGVQVGLTTPAYFRRMFEQQFGVGPREFIRQNAEKKAKEKQKQKKPKTPKNK